jgi:hypothetical protein
MVRACLTCVVLRWRRRNQNHAATRATSASPSIYQYVLWLTWFPGPSSKGSDIWFKLLRCECVRGFPTPLSSDALSRWGKEGGKHHDKEVKKASDWLRDHLVPKVGQVFPKAYCCYRAYGTSTQHSTVHNAQYTADGQVGAVRGAAGRPGYRGSDRL